MTKALLLYNFGYTICPGKVFSNKSCLVLVDASICIALHYENSLISHCILPCLCLGQRDSKDMKFRRQLLIKKKKNIDIRWYRILGARPDHFPKSYRRSKHRPFLWSTRSCSISSLVGSASGCELRFKQHRKERNYLGERKVGRRGIQRNSLNNSN